MIKSQSQSENSGDSISEESNSKNASGSNSWNWESLEPQEPWFEDASPEELLAEACLSGYHPHPLYVVCTHFPE